MASIIVHGGGKGNRVVANWVKSKTCPPGFWAINLYFDGVTVSIIDPSVEDIRAIESACRVISVEQIFDDNAPVHLDARPSEPQDA